MGRLRVPHQARELPVLLLAATAEQRHRGVRDRDRCVGNVDLSGEQRLGSLWRTFVANARGMPQEPARALQGGPHRRHPLGQGGVLGQALGRVLVAVLP